MSIPQQLIRQAATPANVLPLSQRARSRRAAAGTPDPELAFRELLQESMGSH